MKTKVTQLIGLVIGVAGVGACGPEAILGLSDVLGGMSDGLQTLGTCLSPVDPIELNELFALSASADWENDSTVLTDSPQPDLFAYYRGYFEATVIPKWYENERVWTLGPVPAGTVVNIQFIGDAADYAYFYDAELTLLAIVTAHDFNGRLRTVDVPIHQDTPTLHVRAVLKFPSDTGTPLIQLAKVPQDQGANSRPQIVMLDFSGVTGLTFRGGTVVPTDLTAVTDPAFREAAVASFKERYAPFNLTVLTDADPPPAGPFSRIYIGSANPALGYNGMSEMIDGLNAIQDDTALVDTSNPQLALAETFGPEAFGKATGLVAAHEMGHLLGLLHTVDPDDLMTGVGCQGTGLDFERFVQRRFKRAALLEVFESQHKHAIGYQDPEEYLMNLLGSSGNQAELSR